MSEPRNDYGFPLPPEKIPSKTFELLVRFILGDPTVIMLPPGCTKLQRAQAIAAEVRARRFPPVQRITPKEE